jgi:fumarylacetoacetase
MNPGDILGSGTISGKTREARGCLMEYTWNGKEPLTLSTGETRTFIEDGDTIEFRGYAGNGENRVGFGSCIGTVTPALNKDYFEN